MLRGLGSDGLPVPTAAYVGATLIQQGARVVGSGSTSRPGNPTVFASRFAGDLTGTQSTLSVSDLEDEPAEPGPQFTLELRIEGPRDLVGTMSGDPDFVGPITLVRLGPRCFAE